VKAGREARPQRGAFGAQEAWTRLDANRLCGLDPHVAVSVFVSISYLGSRAPKSIDPAVGAQQNVGDQTPVEPANHISPGTQARYLTDPPTSGPHYSVRGEAPLPWGFYARQYPPEDWVHNLEHGGVVILYNCPQPQVLVARGWSRPTCPALTPSLLSGSSWPQHPRMPFLTR